MKNETEKVNYSLSTWVSQKMGLTFEIEKMRKWEWKAYVFHPK